MWVQVTTGQGDTFRTGGLSAEDPEGVRITSPSITRINRPDPEFNIFDPNPFDDEIYDFYLVKWKIFPNPDSEQFNLVFNDGTEIYEVVVDTISGTIPEPFSTLSIIFLGTLGISTALKYKLQASKTNKKVLEK